MLCSMLFLRKRKCKLVTKRPVGLLIVLHTVMFVFSLVDVLELLWDNNQKRGKGTIISLAI